MSPGNSYPSVLRIFGVLWEAAVPAMKKHLRRVINDQKLKFEELSTVLAQVEACMSEQ